MAQVTYDDNSFLIDGDRIWLAGGSVHYFRVPAELWHDRLLKAKRAGLNCISTYVPWNFHEPVEGHWDFEGDRDVSAFVRTAAELGLYVILRPGPYICAEWDFGGLPGWLTSKTGIAYRTNNAAFMHYFDKYFGQVLPRLAELQVTRGGNILLIQNENEYMVGDTTEARAYVEFISQLIRRAGFDIPIISCNFFAGPKVEGIIDTVNGFDQAVQLLKKAHYTQPMSPLMVTEYWCGWFDSWGAETHQTRPPEEVARRAMEILGCGAQFNYYMFHGGTNFAFWGSRLSGGLESYQTTSYDYDAPVAEGGTLGRKYYLTRLVNMLATHMAPYLATAFMDDPGMTIHDASETMNLTGSLGRWAIITNHGRGDISAVKISLPEGGMLDVSLQPFGAAAIPVDVALTPAVTLDYANCTPLGFFNQRILVLHGPEGWQVRLSINGEVISEVIPEGDDPTVIERPDVLVVLISSDLAMRTWLVGEVLVFGPTYVGEAVEDVTLAKGVEQYVLMEMDGKVTRKRLKRTAAAAPRRVAPRLAPFKRISISGEPIDEELQWRKVDRPRDADRLGVCYGYIWYRAELQQKRAARRHLLLPACQDRAHLFLNGKRIGLWGRGPGATRNPIGASLKRGKNVLTVMVDNLGRPNYGPALGELKGLYGQVYDAKPLKTKKFKVKGPESFSRRLVPRHLAHWTARLEAGKIIAAEVDIPMRKVTPLHICFRDIPHTVAVLCNDRPVGLFPALGQGSFGDVTLGAELKSGRNIIKLLIWGDVSPKVLDSIKFYSLLDPITQEAKWSYRPWTLPQEGGRVVGKDLPAWYASTFKYTPTDAPLFLYILAAKKGQIYLNGRNAGRFWTIGPQQRYYLPECWLGEKNELLVFTEGGENPTGSRLEFCPNGPFSQ